MPRNMKEKPMSTQMSFKTPTQAEVERYIAQDHLMRREFIARFVKSGLANLRGVCLPKVRRLRQA